MEAQGGPHARGADGDVALTRARKSALRRAIRLARDQLSATDRAVASAAAEERLWRLPELRSVRTVGLYAAHLGEVDLAGFADRVRAAGARTLLPRVVGDDLELVASTPTSPLVAGYRGIAEPTGPSVDPEQLDVIVVPGVAFDPNGGRLGQGGGHYDRLLARLQPHTVRIGASFACQLVPSVPREDHDLPMDLVVTDRGTYRTGARPLEGG